MSNRRIVSSVISLVLLAAPAVGLWQRQAIFDWWRLRDYSPAQFISNLATETTMDKSMTRLFYVYHPELLDKTEFNSHCREDEQTIVLGCYVSGQGIYLLDVTDSRLNGIEQVTAAHEALHAAYARLSTKEKTRVDALTRKTLKENANQRIRDTIALYEKQDPSVVPNELHSILGTELRKLPPELEAYYSQYFTDRSKIVDYSEKYEKAFTQRKEKLEAYDAQLASLKKEINSKRFELETEANYLLSERQRMDALKSSGHTKSYNDAVPVYNQSVNSYNADISTLKGLIDEFNSIVIKRNAIANEEQELVKAIDSREVVPAKQ